MFESRRRWADVSRLNSENRAGPRHLECKLHGLRGCADMEAFRAQGTAAYPSHRVRREARDFWRGWWEGGVSRGVLVVEVADRGKDSKRTCSGDAQFKRPGGGEKKMCFFFPEFSWLSLTFPFRLFPRGLV